MAAEPKRACGYRKVGGLYMVSGKLGAPCCKMPIILDICPTCNGGVKQTRGWTWIDPRPWLKGPCAREYLINCPAASAEALGERVGLLWIGAQFYPTAEAFADEANRMGLSRRITAIPRGFKLGESWVFLAHPKLKQVTDAETGESKWQGGVFRIFMPERIEKIVTETQSHDVEAMAELAKKGITPFVVPDNDPDHQGTVYDDDTDAPELELAQIATAEGGDPHGDHRPSQ